MILSFISFSYLYFSPIFLSFYIIFLFSSSFWNYSCNFCFWRSLIICSIFFFSIIKFFYSSETVFWWFCYFVLSTFTSTFFFYSYEINFPLVNLSASIFVKFVFISLYFFSASEMFFALFDWALYKGVYEFLSLAFKLSPPK